MKRQALTGNKFALTIMMRTSRTSVKVRGSRMCIVKLGKK